MKNWSQLIAKASSKPYLFLRRIICWILAVAVIATGQTRRARERALQGDVVTPIYFHNPPRTLFANCVRWLLKHGYSFISVGELVEILNEGRAIPPGAVWLSFDDGYKEWVENVLPVIRQYKVPATLFIPPGIISGDGQFPWGGRRLSPDERDSLTLDELLTLASCPEIEIGGHTVNHVITTECDADQLRFEIEVCRKTLQSWTTTAVVSMAYPCGCVDGRERQTIIEAGFAIAATTEPRFINRRTDPLETPRFCVPDQASFPEAICNMVGAWRPLIDPLKRLLHVGARPGIIRASS